MTRVHSIDYLKFVVACVVVLAHTGLFVGDVGAFGYVLGFSYARAAVPTFAVVSGFLFHSTWQHGRARMWLVKLLVAYVAWVIFYAPIWWPDSPTVGAVAHDLIFGPLHLWYIAALFVAVFLLLAVLTVVPDPARARRTLVLLATGALLAGTVLQGIHFFTPADLPMNAYRNGVFVEFPYAAFGFLLADRLQRRGIGSMPDHRTVWRLFLLLAALRLGEALIYLRLYGSRLDFPPEFPFLAAAFSVALLLWTLRLRLPEPPVNLAFLSVLIYFLHLLVMIVAMRFGITGFAGMAALGILVPTAIGLALLRTARMLEWRVPAVVRKLLLRGVLRLSPSAQGTTAPRGAKGGDAG